MVTTHLILFGFFEGATASVAEAASDYGTSHPPIGYWAFNDGATPSDVEPEPEPQPTGLDERSGSGGRRLLRKQRWSVQVYGEWLVFDDLDQLIAYLSAREEKEESRAEEKAARDATRIVSVGKAAKTRTAPPRVKIASPVPEIHEFVADLQAKIDRIYWRKLADELARQAEEDEDIAFISTL